MRRSIKQGPFGMETRKWHFFHRSPQVLLTTPPFLSLSPLSPYLSKDGIFKIIGGGVSFKRFG